jgi:microcystin-dependent protein
MLDTPDIGPDVAAYVTLAVKPTGSNFWAGVAARIQDAEALATYDGYFVAVFHSSGTDTLSFFRVTNNSGTILGSSISQEFSAGDRLGIRIVGNTIEAWRYNGGNWTLLGSREDSTYQDAGKIGVLLGPQTTIRVDDFGGGSLVVGSGESESILSAESSGGKIASGVAESTSVLSSSVSGTAVVPGFVPGIGVSDASLDSDVSGSVLRPGVGLSESILTASAEGQKEFRPGIAEMFASLIAEARGRIVGHNDCGCFDEVSIRTVGPHANLEDTLANLHRIHQCCKGSIPASINPLVDVESTILTAFPDGVNLGCQCDAIYLSREDGSIFLSTDSGRSFKLIFAPFQINGTLVGEIRTYAGDTEPFGWLFCDGREVSRVTYTNLFETIGTAWGLGDGSTTFNIPDLRGSLSAGVSGSHAAGSFVGEEEHTLIADELPTHTHVYQRRNATGGVDNGFDSTGTISSLTDTATSSVGGDQPHNNMQPTIFLNRIIKI